VSLSSAAPWLEYTTPQDEYFNYCWWPYAPVASTQGKLRPISLLFHSFELAGLDEAGWQLVRAIQRAIGPFRTVWGAKWLGGRLAWEFYFYDYKRRDRDLSISRVLDAIRPFVPCEVPVNESLPYFMFSLDVNPAPGGLRALDVVHLYVGNPGSVVSSGIAYALRRESTTLENFYFFFDAERHLGQAVEKICCSAHLDATRVDIDHVLWPELRACKTICVANKQRNDTVYFSGVDVNGLLFFLRRLRYPAAIISFVEQHHGQLDHLLYDVGFDYITDGPDVLVVKSGYYGVF
jgi:hypothetical protein